MENVVECVQYRDTSTLVFEIDLSSCEDAAMERPQSVKMSFREILNLFIGEGFYNASYNYLNSKLSYGDIRMLAFFILEKFKSGSFDDLITNAQQQ